MAEDTAAIAALIMAAAGLLTAAGIAIRALAARLGTDGRQGAAQSRSLGWRDGGGGGPGQPPPQHQQQQGARFEADATGRYPSLQGASGYPGVDAAAAAPATSPLESVVQRLEGVVLNMQSYATHEDIRRLEDQITRLSNKVDDYAADLVDHRRTSDRLARTLASLRHQVVELEAHQERSHPDGGTRGGPSS